MSLCGMEWKGKNGDILYLYFKGASSVQGVYYTFIYMYDPGCVSSLALSKVPS